MDRLGIASAGQNESFREPRRVSSFTAAGKMQLVRPPKATMKPKRISGEDQNDMRFALWRVQSMRLFKNDPRKEISEAVALVMEKNLSVDPDSKITPAEWQTKTGEPFALSAARYCMDLAAENRAYPVRASSYAQKALLYLETLGVRERFHLLLFKTGIRPAVWKRATGESFSVSLAKRHFLAMEQERKSAKTDNAAMKMMARKYASAAGIKRADDLAGVMGVSAVRWECAAGCSFEPFEGEWREMGRLTDPKGGPARPLNSFCLCKPVETGPNAVLG
ncbi:MAG: hypothetical protein HGA90_01935 [Alphaproteobacteria bacterium]|nr:hypothetical protein [Alphaproteobacteria bacterium]